MDIEKIISEMTLEEKADLCCGADFWHTKSMERFSVPSMMMCDGPHGLRKQDTDSESGDVNVSKKAVCFPTACTLACSFDRNLIYKLGQTLGNQCQAEDVGVILGPGVNIKRSPVCGRNFEYYSEDPYLASNIAASHIKGVQSKGVGACPKHFLANNQENRRMTVDAEIDERTINEIYLAAFETAVREGKPSTVMCAYNRLNGVFISENKKYLKEVLRDKWGFEGFVVSDWGAVNERAKGIEAGLDLDMPASCGANNAKIVKAVRDGSLSEADLNESCRCILREIKRYVENRNTVALWDKDADHEFAAEIASECMVLLKNEDSILPLDRNARIAFIGKFADKPRFQGGGSSHINAHKITSALEAVSEFAQVSYAQGYHTDRDETDEALLAEAVALADKSDIAVVFAGLTDLLESEAFDRDHMKMPDCQNELISRIVQVQPNTVVVLHNGSPIEMPWLDSVKGVLESYLGGQAVGKAQCALLFGEKNPCGKLAETFPVKLSDNPSYLNFPGEKDRVCYREGIFVGYRYYDYKEMQVLFPFGYGLSYTDFEYSNLIVSSDRLSADEKLEVTVTVKNTGKVKGKEIVQLYVRDCESSVIRPLKELKGFEKIELEPNQSGQVSFTLDRRSFAFYSEVIHDWFVESGDFEILIGKSSRDIVLSAKVYVESDDRMPYVCTSNSRIGDLLEIECARKYMGKLIEAYAKAMQTDGDCEQMGENTKRMLECQLQDNPLRVMVSFSDGAISHKYIEDVVNGINSELGN